MVIAARTIVGAAAAFSVAGAALWMLSPAQEPRGGSVEITQVQERSWAVEIKDLGVASTEPTRTAANR